MACFAADFEVSEPDRQLLRAVARGEKRALERAVERLCPVILALDYHGSKDFAAAQSRMESVVRDLFHSVLVGELAPEQFAGEANRRLAGRKQAEAETDSAGSQSLHSLHGATKLVRRRAAVRAIEELPPAALVALVLRYHAGWPAEQMVGIVADTSASVWEVLVGAHRAVVEAMRAGD